MKKLDECIIIEEDWSQESNLNITNKKKNTILEFIHRRSRTVQMNFGEILSEITL